jgi:hypothetical protein
MLSLDLIFDLLFQRTAAGAAVVLGIASLVTLLITPRPDVRRIAGFLLWICAFSVYDVFGYDVIVMTDSTAQHTMRTLPDLRDAYGVSLNAYRILQVSFQILLSAAVLFATGWRGMIAGNLFWWGGGCDLLFYALTFRAMPDSWEWLWFTPVGMVYSSLALTTVLLQSLLLTATAIALLSPLACRYLPCRALDNRGPTSRSNTNG